jgi:nicotinamide mononucleotide transporter
MLLILLYQFIMEDIIKLFSVNNTFFTLLGYQMSYIEFFGTLLSLGSVILAARNKIWTWPIGNLGAILFGILFYQIQLYSDFFEQIYFIITGFIGWYIWSQPDFKNEEINDVTTNTKATNYIYIGSILVLSVILGVFMSNIHNIFPTQFPIPAAYPFPDAITTIMSFAATILMMKKKIECWYLWIIVDVIGIGLYYKQGVVFISLLYVLFLIIAIQGYLHWRKVLMNKPKTI